MESILVGAASAGTYPKDSRDLPVKYQHIHDERGHNFVVRWASEVGFDDGKSRGTVWFNVLDLGEVSA